MFMEQDLGYDFFFITFFKPLLQNSDFILFSKHFVERI